MKYNTAPNFHKGIDTRPTVLLSVLTTYERTGWINPLLFGNLIQLSSDRRFRLFLAGPVNVQPVATARNGIIIQAREQKADYCIQVDNDMVLPADFANILDQTIRSKKALVGLGSATVGRASDGISKGQISHSPVLQLGAPGPVDPDNPKNFRESGPLGGVLIISAEIWRTLPGPWFKWVSADDELGSRIQGEDFYFWNRVQEAGFKAWTHASLAGHFKTVDILPVAIATNRF